MSDKKLGQDKQIIAEFKSVSFAYGNEQLLKDASMQILKGDFAAIIGPNGAGKTTIIRLLLGLLSPTHGTIVLFGNKTPGSEEKKRIAYVPQKATHFDQQFPATVLEVVSTARYSQKGLFKSLNDSDQKIIHTALEAVGMYAERGTKVGELSGGQQQRVFIARALAAKPDFLILDEPTVGVDTESQKVFYSLLHELNHKHGMTLLFVTHDTAMISKYINKLICVNRGLTIHDSKNGFFSDDLACAYAKDMKQIAHSHDHNEFTQDIEGDKHD